MSLLLFVIFLFLFSPLVLFFVLASPPQPQLQCDRSNPYRIGVSANIIDSSFEVSFSQFTSNASDSLVDVWGYYTPSQNFTGWNFLCIWPGRGGNPNPWSMSFAAGYLEGRLTGPQIPYHLNNLAHGNYHWNISNFTVTLRPAIRNYLVNQRLYSRGFLFTNSSDPVEKMAGYLYAQFEGLYTGHVEASLETKSPLISQDDLWLIGAAGDYYDLVNIFPDDQVTNGEGKEKEKNQKQSSRFPLLRLHHLDSPIRPSSVRSSSPSSVFPDEFRKSCSVLVKLLPDGSDLLVGHSTWTSFYGMMRIYKDYTLNFQEFPGYSSRVTQSSYPGQLGSKDDWFQTDNSLAVTETTIEVSNDLFSNSTITSNSLLSFQRAIIACRLSTNIGHWISVFSQKNSGTYNNQWILVDFKLFTPKQPLLPFTVVIAEQYPGGVEVTDVTKRVAYTSYRSFNEIYSPTLNQLCSAEPKYDLAIRATLFREIESQAVNMSSFLYVMSYNNYLKDELENGDPCASAISARCDLLSAPVFFGGIDTKATSYGMKKQYGSVHAAYIRSGPSAVNVPPFVVNSIPVGQNRPIGLPPVFNFSAISFA